MKTGKEQTTLLKKKNPTPKDAGRLMMLELIEFKRLDQKGHDPIPPDVMREYISRAVVGCTVDPSDPDGGYTYQCYREAYHKFIEWPDVASSSHVCALWMLESMNLIAHDILHTEKQLQADTQNHVILSMGQYKALLKKDAATKKKKVSLRSIFRTILDYLLDRIDIEDVSALPFYLTTDDVNTLEGGAKKNYRSMLDAWRVLKIGKPVTPLEALKNHKRYYSDSFHDEKKNTFDLFRNIGHHFPELAQDIVAFMEDECGFADCDTLFNSNLQVASKADWPTIQIEDVINSRVGFLYKHLLVAPQKVAITMEPAQSVTRTIKPCKEDYTPPPAPFWVSKTFDRAVNMQDHISMVREKAISQMKHFLRWHVFFQLCADMFDLPELMLTIRTMEDIEEAAQKYNDTVFKLFQFEMERLRMAEIDSAALRKHMTMFMPIVVSDYAPTPEAVESVRSKLNLNTFMTSHLILMQELELSQRGKEQE